MFRFSRFFSTLSIIAMLSALMPSVPLAHAATVSTPARFDFGTAGSPVEAGYIGVTLDQYTAARGYGWVSRVLGGQATSCATWGALLCDYSYANDATFKVNLDPTKTYTVRVYHANTYLAQTSGISGIYQGNPAGQPVQVADNFGVYAEGVLAYTIPLLPPGGRIDRTISNVKISSDGVLELRFRDFGGQGPYFTVSGVEILSEGTAVQNRQLFYNQSYFDGNNVAANATDDAAVALHTPKTGGHGHSITGDEVTRELGKDALLPGQTASFANVSNYDKGINGVMIDIAKLPSRNLTASDFSFRTLSYPCTWATAPAPSSITVRRGAGLNGSDRVTIIWPTQSIRNAWLEVTVLPTANTGLTAKDTFFFGNLVGEGDGDLVVTQGDELRARTFPHSLFNPATAADPYDYNKDRYVHVMDEILARNNKGAQLPSSLQCRVPSADLSLTKQGSATVKTGTGLTYTVTATNLGPDTAENVKIIDKFPTGLQYLGSSLGSACTASGDYVTCNTGSLTASGKVVVALFFNVPTTMTCGSGMTISNVASVSSTTPDPNYANNSNATSPVVTTVLCPVTAATSNLFVTRFTTPDMATEPPRQLLGGTVGDPVLGLKFWAQGEEDVRVDAIRLLVSGVAPDVAQKNVAALELYRYDPVTGSSVMFAVATTAQCGADVPPLGTTLYCATGMGDALVVSKNVATAVLVRPRMNTDQMEAVSGEYLTFSLLSSEEGTPVFAFGVSSKQQLVKNNGDAVASGEVFIGTGDPGPDMGRIGSKKNRVVLSKVVSITNADTTPDGTIIPTGMARDIGQFKFSAAANNNSKNELNNVVLSDILFNVNAANVDIDSGSYVVYNKADPLTIAHCYVAQQTGDNLSVSCPSIGNAGVNNQIDSGADITLVLSADISNAKVNNSSASALQVSLQNFSDSTAASYGPDGSHIRWLDQDAGSSTPFLWIEYPTTTVNGTAYKG